MTHEKDLLIRALAGEPPLGIDLDAVERLGARRVRRRHATATVGAAATVAALLVGGLALVPRLTAGSAPASPPGEPSVASNFSATAIPTAACGQMVDELLIVPSGEPTGSATPSETSAVSTTGLSTTADSSGLQQLVEQALPQGMSFALTASTTNALATETPTTELFSENNRAYVPIEDLGHTLDLAVTSMAESHSAPLGSFRGTLRDAAGTEAELLITVGWAYPAECGFPIPVSPPTAAAATTATATAAAATPPGVEETWSDISRYPGRPTVGESLSSSVFQGDRSLAAALASDPSGRRSALDQAALDNFVRALDIDQVVRALREN